MIKTILGFSSFPGTVNNAPFTVADVGELSTYSLTYSKDVGEYSDTNYPNTILRTFTAVDKDDKAIELDTIYSTGLLQLSDWVLSSAKDGTFTNDKVTALQQLKANFDDQYDELTIGDMKTDGVVFMPSWVSGKLKSDTEDNYIKLWFSDPAFRLEYPRFQHTVVHPVPRDKLDTLHEDYAAQKKLVDGYSKNDVIQWVNDAIDGSPETMIIHIAFKVYDKMQSDLWQWMYWQIVDWGAAGNNEDAIYDSIRNDILANSEYDEDEWGKVIPDLFNPIEFTLIPDWTSYSVPNKETIGGLLSPVTDYASALELPKKVLTYSESHITSCLQSFPVNYKSGNVFAVGKPNNRNGVIKLREMYPDYTIIPSTADEFDRMSPDTTDFILKLEKMLIAAETMTEYSEIPPGVSRTIRNGVVYTALTIQGVKFIMATRPYIESLSGGSE